VISPLPFERSLPASHPNGGVGGRGIFIQKTYVNACSGVFSFPVRRDDANGDIVDSFAVLGFSGHWVVRRHSGSLLEDRTSGGLIIAARGIGYREFRCGVLLVM
jgi:hypothetical protein